MDTDTERRLSMLTEAVIEAVVTLGADPMTTLKLLNRATGFLHLLCRLYEQRDSAHMAALLAQFSELDHEEAEIGGAKQPLLAQP
ncbi:MAG TPA: hypothetical protein VKQ30_25205 [Ktedonobacterales bacterium]|nr:hypothetical protein [Ktedonobacterales bacterium]